jgi:hypothetical protein
MARWERAVLKTSALDHDLGCEVAEMAAVVKGYGDVRRRLAGALERFLDEVLPGAVASDRESGRGYGRAVETVRDARRVMLADEKGIEAALAHA